MTPLIDTGTIDPVSEHREALRVASRIAENNALRRLRGERVRNFDSRGLDPYSEEWGRIQMLETLLPALATFRKDVNPISMRRAAEKVARSKLAVEIRAEFPHE